MKIAGKILLLAGVLILCICRLSWGSASANHTVTVTASAINELVVTGGNLTLTINTATAGSEPDEAADSTTCDLIWTTNEVTKKITVETDNATPTFGIRVKSRNVTGGTEGGNINVTTTATDFVTTISTTTGGCDIQYTVSAEAADGTGTDVHTVTFTLTDE